MQPNPVERVIKHCGGPTPTLKALILADDDPDKAGVSYWTLREWRKSGRVPDSRYAVLLSRVSGGTVSVDELAGLEVSGSNGDEPKGRGFLKGGRYRLPATYQVPSPDLPVVPRFPETAARAA